ncbi:hypothetical protein [Sphingomonas kyeonggiensis]|uniref:DUF4760 domain-containing protein n=1 Tax=Sphingomonas kyeonggiensis TaxID=1268553 RepID=A0A7W6JXD8_9SPHN|nr:hypothetical protein [Sphingomonas kyeonggiensis]MBB4101278.1 hypothetical protein [Sphingomonas kyeonggiensis]
MIWLLIAIVVGLALVLLTCAASKSSRKSRMDKIATIAQSVGIAASLFIFGLQECQREFSEKEKSDQAIAQILLTSYDPGAVDEAFGALKLAEGPDLSESVRAEFNGKAKTLTSYFWAVDRCVTTKLCANDLAKKTFCEDFRRYENALARVNGIQAMQRELKFFEAMRSCPGSQG